MSSSRCARLTCITWRLTPGRECPDRHASWRSRLAIIRRRRHAGLARRHLCGSAQVGRSPTGDTANRAARMQPTATTTRRPRNASSGSRLWLDSVFMLVWQARHESGYVNELLFRADQRGDGAVEELIGGPLVLDLWRASPRGDRFISGAAVPSGRSADWPLRHRLLTCCRDFPAVAPDSADRVRADRHPLFGCRNGANVLFWGCSSPFGWRPIGRASAPIRR